MQYLCMVTDEDETLVTILKCIEILKYYVVYWASLVSQLIKNLPAMQETLVHFLGWEDPLKKG